jgi:hypothetical protein
MYFFTLIEARLKNAVSYTVSGDERGISAGG